MGMDPGAAELLGPAAQVHLPVEEVGHGLVVEGHRDPGAYLPHQLDVLDVEQVVGRRDAEAAHLGLAQVAQVEELRPGGGAEAQRSGGSAQSGSGSRSDRLVSQHLRLTNHRSCSSLRCFFVTRLAQARPPAVFAERLRHTGHVARQEEQYSWPQAAHWLRQPEQYDSLAAGTQLAAIVAKLAAAPLAE